MERQEEERMRAYIKAPFSLTFVLSVWRATMNINMNPWRGNTPPPTLLLRLLLLLLLTGLFMHTRRNYSS